jgi:hypothetical protein
MDSGAWRTFQVLAFGLVLSVALGACSSGAAGVGLGAGGGGSNPRCTTYCRARQTKGCGGDESLCRLACNTGYSVATSQGSCTQAYTELSDCQSDPAILELGCSPPVNKTDEFCKTQSDAYAACVKQRDGT